MTSSRLIWRWLTWTITVRKTAAAHHAAFPLIATRHPAAPWLLPLLRSLALVEQFLSALSSFQLTDHQAVAAYRSFNTFLLGTRLLEAAVRGAELAPDDATIDEGRAQIPENDTQVSLGEAPTISRCQGLLSEDHSEEEFEAALGACWTGCSLPVAITWPAKPCLTCQPKPVGIIARLSPNLSRCRARRSDGMKDPVQLPIGLVRSVRCSEPVRTRT